MEIYHWVDGAAADIPEWESPSVDFLGACIVYREYE
jgi:hypothetical protein